MAIAAIGLGCRPEAASSRDACQSASDCAEGQRCTEGRCRPDAAMDGAGSAAMGRAGAAGGAIGPTSVPRLSWDVPLGSAISTTPALWAPPDADPIALVGTHAGRFVGVMADGGTVALDLIVDGIIWSSPLVTDDGRAYFGADDDHLYAVDLRAENVVWRRRLGDCTPTRAPGPEGLRCDVDGGPVLAPDGDLYVGADGLYRVARDGAVAWHWPSEPGVVAPHVASRPLVTESLVVFGAHDGFVTALDHEGRERWRHEVGADVDGSAIVADDGTIVIGSDGGRILALDPDDGRLRWALATGKDVRSGIARGPDGLLFATSYDGRLYALTAQGRVRFVVPTEEPVASTPVVDDAGVVYFGGRDDRLYAVTADGRVRWNVELPADVDGGVAITRAGTIVVGCDDGHLRGLR